MDLKITVRTLYFTIFYNIFYKSFMKYYPNYKQNLILIIDGKSPDLKKYKEFCKNENIEYKTCYLDLEYGAVINLLYESLNYKKVITFDDDIEFIKGGFIAFIEMCFDQYKLIGEDSKTNDVKGLSTWVLAKRDINITLEDLTGKKEEFLETYGITKKYKDDIYFYEKTSGFNNIEQGHIGEYYIHYSNLSNAVINQKIYNGSLGSHFEKINNICNLIEN